MKTVDLSRLELGDAWYDSDETVRWRDTLPLTAGTPGASEVSAGDLVVVYFEVDPGKRIGRHTDSEEEVLLAIAGTVAVTVGDGDDGELSAGEMAVVPPNVPHGITNVGDEPAAVVGFFPSGEVTHGFDEPVMPDGERMFVSRPEA
ncbi:cupin domain-containing protein [Halosolutus gelatinilyticus]|uniref:cupin domain-containing protein n=1 Tax=Halosolutus gelatinilyticus TaxID=2931975 RepID=UPI001FF37BFE|nr:cupin domain-containing protein [Halosolutus gelatinilyticus]